MTYVMSDIHGCYNKYVEMLAKIEFSTADRLYILGDVVDRGSNGMKVLLDIAKHNNIILLMGNHDQEALLLLSQLYKLIEEEVSDELLEVYQMWLSDGGNATVSEFLQLSVEEQIKALQELKNALYYKEVIINDVKYLLAHTVPEKEELQDIKSCDSEAFLMGEPEYEKQYFEDVIIITGHTPTEYIDQASKGRIWRGNNHIAVDCGAVYGNSLGCICLETGEEYYSE
ncbi:MAG: metallophosphoesterase [Lachnospiraceae bacterium]|nr:metallophosphoesterase [Lachnospiraceae bacterium]